ncbi:L-fucose-proton symporter [bioreactor metagenome]|uniref:L-fucose-proton symporter n=1 Tax=bioreactor metagenome TaxID=1076179 RepID=A0A645CXP4_9ZZZZ
MQKKRQFQRALLLAAFLFFIFGFLTWVNGTLIAFFKKTFELNHFNSYLVTFAYYLSYTLMAIPSSMVLKKMGFKNGMSTGLLIMALGCGLFIPAAKLASYPIFLVGLFTTGIGLTLLQTAINPYVTLMGPHESGAKRISFMGFSNKIGGIIGQLVLGSILLHGATNIVQQDELNKIIFPYLIITALFVVMSFILRKNNWFPEIEEEKEEHKTLSTHNDKKNVFQFPNLVLGVIALFCAGATEVMAIDSIINYGMSLGFPETRAKLFGSFTLIAMIMGYLSGMILIPKYIKQEKLLKYGAITGSILAILVIYSHSSVSVFMVSLLGFVNALFWPAIWPLALEGLGRFVKIGSALLIMSVVAGAVVPLLYGLIADTIDSTQKAYWILIPCYLFIAYYGYFGYKIKSWDKQNQQHE